MSDNIQQVINRIVVALKDDPGRDVYESKWPRGEYWISYQGGGPFHYHVVERMVAEGILVRKYKGCECYKLAENKDEP